MQDLKFLEPYMEQISAEMHNLQRYQVVPNFYDPIYYVLGLGGKKFRPLLLLLSCGICGGKIKNALPAAAAVELLHDFSLVHDDIMDNDPTRRGKPTVHLKWDLNTAILAGDGLLGFAFQKLLQTESKNIAELARRFTKAMIIICEGQGLDKLFEQKEKISEQQYLDMIDRKTAALIRLSCEMGALIADADKDKIAALSHFGQSLGMGFQIQDDVLDILADENVLGKKVGSDFELDKQTILTIKLKKKIGLKNYKKLKLSEYKEQLEKLLILKDVTAMVDKYFDNCYKTINMFKSSESRNNLLELTKSLHSRVW